MLRSTPLLFALVCSTAAFASPSPKQTVPRGAASPSKIQLQSRKVLAGSSLRRRALGPANVPLDDFFKGTDLQWFGNISVGTPPQDITVSPVQHPSIHQNDTGFRWSSTLVFDIGIREHTLRFLLEPSPIRSYDELYLVDGGRTAVYTFETGVGVDPVVGNNTQLELRSAVDTVTVGGLTTTDVDLFLITSQTPNFDIDPFSGIQGMGARAQGFFAGLIDQGLPSLFSLLLTPNDVGCAELTIGGIDESKFEGDLVFASIVGDSDFWELDSPGIFVNGQTTGLLSGTRRMTFDSGTSNMVFSTDTTVAIYALISPEIKPNPDEPGTFGISCDLIDSLPAEIALTFTSEDGSSVQSDGSFR
ncbi:acid protease [Hymenopellis radicata]|nr:acid protease [Hymenopellis radicata]